MLEVVLLVILGFWVLALVGCIWVLICNQATHKQRGILIDDIWDNNNKTLLSNYNKVTYDQHLWRLVTFRWNWRSWYYEAK